LTDSPPHPAPSAAQPDAGATRHARTTVLVLGGTGFLGQALVRRLLHGGFRVRALVRHRSGRAAPLAQQGVERVEGDLMDTPSVDAALEGVEHVFHLARGSGAAWNDYLRTDVEPTHRIAERCSARGIGLSYTSSIAIYDAGRAGEHITETTAPSPACLRLNAYARAKADNERGLLALHRERGLKVVIFRPGIVVGRGGSPHHPGVGAWPDPSRCRPWGGGRDPLPFVLVDDCADAMVRALDVADVAGDSFNLIGDVRLTGNAYLDALEQLAGTRITRAPLSTPRLFVQSVVKWGYKVLVRAPDRPLPSYRYCAALSRRASFGADHAKQRLGWLPVSDPAVFIEQGIAVPVAESRS